jgi:hypothetical protein
MVRLYLKALWRHWTKFLTSGTLIAVAGAWVLTGYKILPVVGAAIVVLAFLQASFGAWTEEYQRNKRSAPHIDVEIVKDARPSIPHNLGATPWLWGLKIRNDGATATFQASVELTSGVSHALGRRRPLSFTRENGRQSTIITGAEDRVFFALLYWNVMYGGSLGYALWYFDEEERRDKDALIVLSTSEPRGGVAEFEVTIVSDPPMESPWKRLFQLGPGNQLRDVTSTDVVA